MPRRTFGATGASSESTKVRAESFYYLHVLEKGSYLRGDDAIRSGQLEG